MLSLKTFVQKFIRANPKNKQLQLPSIPPENQAQKSKNQGSNMLDGLITAFKAEYGLAHAGDLFTSIHSIVQGLEDNYVKDGNARNAAIDSVCQYLQSLKK